MRKKDTLDVGMSVLAALVDGVAVFGSFMLATWMRFDSGWFAVTRLPPQHYYQHYAWGALVATFGYLVVFYALNLFVRPQTGSFASKIPRMIRGCVIGLVTAMVMAFAVQNDLEYSRLALFIGGAICILTVLLERYLAFRVEWNVARHAAPANRVLILGTDRMAFRLRRTLQREAMLRAHVVGFLRTREAAPATGISEEDIHGSLDDLETVMRKLRIDRLIVADDCLNGEQMMQLIVVCEQNLAELNVVPDLFRMMTVSMDVHALNDIPLLGMKRWPLDAIWNRMLKRMEDVVGSLLALVVVSPLLLILAAVIKLDSRGPVLYVQERCGRQGRIFRLYKLRTMRADAEKETGPVFAAAGDARRTRVGGFLRKYNLDELPQLWNVLRGDMSLVGPRPERPHFVEKFKEDVSRYMWRHVSKPGLTGWAQVNGLRGDTSIEERIKYDLYYLENWSLSFDFKVLARTLFAYENAY